MTVATFSFRAEFAGGDCPNCSQQIAKGELINYAEDSRPQHTDCSPDFANVDAKDTVLWNVSGATLDRYDRLDAEEAQIAPLQRPTCPSCWMELPKSMVCGTCT